MDDLSYASGISKSIVLADIRAGVLRQYKGRIWYLDAIQYNLKKAEDGIVDMYPVSGFGERLLAVIDEHIARDGSYR